ncbi:MAG: helix-turn-helix transcriptional regulator [Sphaerochaetaceae bacterium]|nr:helix-turn-helix transcriptional regulator [Sphaerochaetaceae bacterium]
MDLREYLYLKRLDAQYLAEKIGCSVQTIRQAVKGKGLSFKMAQKISMATNLEVGIRDLMPEIYIFCVAEYRRQTTHQNLTEEKFRSIMNL